MTQLMDISFGKLIELLSSQEIFNDELIICDVDAAATPQRDKEIPPVRIDALIFYLVLNGEASINIDYITCRLQKGTLLMMSDLHVMYDIRLSPDFKCYVMMMTKDYAFPIIDELRKASTIAIDFKHYKPVIRLVEEETSLFMEIISKIRKYIKTDNHFFQGLIIKNEVSNFLGEWGNIILSRSKNKSTDLTLSHREEIIFRFARLLLYNCKTQHEVSFYAGELCMSPRKPVPYSEIVRGYNRQQVDQQRPHRRSKKTAQQSGNKYSTGCRRT
jgi:hypothetical protein